MTGDERPFDRWDEAVRLFVEVSTRTGSQVSAIREVRERFGIDLVTAKEVVARVEGYRDLAAKEAELVGPLRVALDELEEGYPTGAATRDEVGIAQPCSRSRGASETRELDAADGLEVPSHTVATERSYVRKAERLASTLSNRLLATPTSDWPAVVRALPTVRLPAPVEMTSPVTLEGGATFHHPRLSDLLGLVTSRLGHANGWPRSKTERRVFEAWRQEKWGQLAIIGRLVVCEADPGLFCDELSRAARYRELDDLEFSSRGRRGLSYLDVLRSGIRGPVLGWLGQDRELTRDRLLALADEIVRADRATIAQVLAAHLQHRDDLTRRYGTLPSPGELRSYILGDVPGAPDLDDIRVCGTLALIRVLDAMTGRANIGQ